MSSGRAEPLIDLGSLPFHVGESATPSNDGLPDALPFVVGVRPDVGLIVQMPDAGVQRHLEAAYRKGSIIGTPMAAEGLGRRYADDFLDFVLRALPGRDPRGLRVLELGCGNGYLLSRLKELGAEVLGVEPGRQGEQGAEAHGVEIIRDMFPTERIAPGERFDVILTYAVLEHVIDPARFLELQAERLTEWGRLIFSVPDCTDSILTGDVSMLLHEHWNYFSSSSLRRLAGLVGLRLERLERSGYGGALYAVAEKGGAPAAAEPAEGPDEAALFEARVKDAIESAGRFFAGSAGAGKSLGIFCAIRAINLLHILGRRGRLRFFDDDPRLHGKFYPPFDIPVESRALLLAAPVDELLIMSWSFGSKLKAELSREGALGRTRITPVEEVFGN